MRSLLTTVALFLSTGCAIETIDPDFDGEARPGVAAKEASKVDVCHWSEDDEEYVVVNVSSSSAHLDSDKHANDVLAGDWYPDADADGEGDSTAAASECPDSLGSHVDNNTDCDDDDNNNFAGNEEECEDEQDNDCDGDIDEDCSSCEIFDVFGGLPAVGEWPTEQGSLQFRDDSPDTDHREADGWIHGSDYSAGGSSWLYVQFRYINDFDTDHDPSSGAGSYNFWFYGSISGGSSVYEWGEDDEGMGDCIDELMDWADDHPDISTSNNACPCTETWEAGLPDDSGSIYGYCDVNADSADYSDWVELYAANDWDFLRASTIDWGPSWEAAGYPDHQCSYGVYTGGVWTSGEYSTLAGEHQTCMDDLNELSSGYLGATCTAL